MKVNVFFRIALMGLLLATISSCKDDIIDPTPQNHCSTCSCLEFNSTGIDETFTSTNYGPVFYYQANISLKGKYADYTQAALGTGSCQVVPATTAWQNKNSNFSGEILRFGDNDLLFDYSNYSSLSKTISFDVSESLGNNYMLKVNGIDYNALPSNIVLTSTALTNGYHIEISGDITTIEIGGFELAIDNMCLEVYTPPSGCINCSCYEFDTVGFNETFTSMNYGAVFYSQGNISLKGKYVNYSFSGNGSGTFDAIPVTTAWQNENTNFSGKILRFKNSDVLFDYSNYPSLGKTVSFDMNKDALIFYGFKVNGIHHAQLPNTIFLTRTPVANGYHIEVSGDITSIELGGKEIVIDNMCLSDFAHPHNFAGCIAFGDTTINENCPVTQTTYGPAFYSAGYGDVSFRYKYVDYEGLSGLTGSVFWGAPNSYGVDENVNFSNTLLQVNNCDLEVDFSPLVYTNKRVSFDIANSYTISNTNEFSVNGAAINSLPAGITYNIISLGNANNGSPCFRVEIEGPINTIVLKGWETTYDNLCVEPI